jgi:two-component system, NarL family, sensor kinase
MDAFETTIYTAVLITSLVIGAIIAYFAVTIFRNHNRHFRLLRQYVLKEVELLERERARIAADLHDELGPILAVAQIHLDAIEVAGLEDEKHLKRAFENITVLNQRLSGIARNLTPKILVTKGLYSAIEDFLDQVKEVSSIKIEFGYSADRQPDVNISLHIYRIIQELVHNAVKHSGASFLQIKIAERKEKLYLSYLDDGKGISNDHLQQGSKGLGLDSLQSRALMLGGKMSIYGDRKKGTEYFFEIPLAEKK